MSNSITGHTYVLAGEWGVSYSTGTGIDGAILNVYRCDEDAPNAWGGRGVVIHHPEFHGLQFGSADEAAVFAAEVGLLQVYVSRLAS